MDVPVPRFNKLGWLWLMPPVFAVVSFVLMALVTARLPWLDNAAQRGGASLGMFLFALLLPIPLANLSGWLAKRSRKVFLAVFWALLVYPVIGALIYHLRYPH
jgi:hypothetical protein